MDVLKGILWFLFVLPLKVAWILFKICATIVLLFLPPWGWAFIVGWWATGKVIDNDKKPKQVVLVDASGNPVEFKVKEK